MDNANFFFVLTTTENIRKVFKKMWRELEPGNNEHSILIDLVNHGDTLAQSIEEILNE